MKVYYLINPDLGWDNVVCIGISIKAVYQSYYEGEGEAYTSDQDSKSRFEKDDLVLMDTILCDEE